MLNPGQELSMFEYGMVYIEPVSVHDRSVAIERIIKYTQISEEQMRSIRNRMLSSGIAAKVEYIKIRAKN